MSIHSSPLAIIPKFLWQPIIELVPTINLVAMTNISKKFAPVIDDQCKKRFLGISGIVVVECKSKRINNFWSFALVNHNTYSDIIDALRAISNQFSYSTVIGRFSKIPDIKKKIAYYKIFVNGCCYITDRYMHVNQCDTDLFELHFDNCGIELIGEKQSQNKTVIRTHKNIQKKLIITISSCFTIKNISMYGIQLHIGRFTSSNDETKLCISNCEFNNGFNLTIHSIDNVVIEKSSLRWFTVSIDSDIPKINYTIAHNNFYYSNVCIDIKSQATESSIINIIGNTFSNHDVCIKFSGHLTESSVININNNTITKSKLLCDASMINALISICNNSISDLNSCINYHRDNCDMQFIFNGNICSNVKKLCWKTCRRISLVPPKIACDITYNTLVDSMHDIYGELKGYYDKSSRINIIDNTIVNTYLLEDEASVEDIAMLFAQKN